MGWLRKLFAKPCNGRVLEAAQVNRSASRLLTIAAQEQSIHAKCVQYQAKEQLRDKEHPASEALHGLVDFMARKPK
jgi:hypothetical protein